MNAKASTVSFQNPRGFEIEGSMLQDFERSLDLLNPQASRIPCHVLG